MRGGVMKLVTSSEPFHSRSQLMTAIDMARMVQVYSLDHSGPLREGYYMYRGWNTTYTRRWNLKVHVRGDSYIDSYALKS